MSREDRQAVLEAFEGLRVADDSEADAPTIPGAGGAQNNERGLVPRPFGADRFVAAERRLSSLASAVQQRQPAHRQ